MASKDMRGEAERKPKQKGQKRRQRRQSRQDMKAQRVGALDRMAQGGGQSMPPEVQARFDQVQAKMAAMGGPANRAGGGQPGMIGPPDVQQGPPQTLPPQTMPPEQVTPGTRLGGPNPPQTMPPQTLPPQPAIEPQPIQAMPPQMMPPEVQVDPMQEPMPVEQYGQPQPQPVDQMGGQVDPYTGEYMSPNTMPPATQDEARIQADMDTAMGQGQVFNTQPYPAAPPEQFYGVNTLGRPGQPQNPRDIERIRRKRMALLNPQVQQLRPMGRGLPQIRFQGGPAFQGAFQQPPLAGAPQRLDQRQPFVR